jgi:nitroimidazol reductase NimA-like FMN-containing flavoprotein (pyridoxamine 5'-phosphate oxidase superfamily)
VNSAQTGQVDSRFSAPEAEPTPWSEVEELLDRAELYWISTVRADGRPHVTPLIAVLHEGAMYFSTGLREQKAHNLERNANVALTTGRNDSAGGIDVVVEGAAVRVTGRERLQALADAVEAKYGAVWHFDVEGDEGFEAVGGVAAVFRIDAAKVLAFAKDPFAQTTFRL